jgi:hypothetical protein
MFVWSTPCSVVWIQSAPFRPSGTFPRARGKGELVFWYS